DGVKPYAKSLGLHDADDFVITYNGAVIRNLSSDEVVFSERLEYDDLMELHKLADKLGVAMHYFYDEILYTSNAIIDKYTIHEAFANHINIHYKKMSDVDRTVTLPKVMFVGEPYFLDEVVAKIPDDIKSRYKLLRSEPFFLEITHPQVGKGKALKRLAEHFELAPEDVLAIGDGGNDKDMVEFAGTGIAMGNASDDVKETADDVVASNEEDGVAEAIKKYILKK